LSSLARLEAAAGDERAARAVLQELLKVDPANRQARLSLAQMALRVNDVATAIGELESARKAEPQAADARLLLASIYLRQRKSKEADELLGELQSLGRQNAAVAVATGRLYASVGRYDEALGLFRSAAQRDPKNATWLLDVARVQQARGDRLAARVTLDQALILEPDSIAANAQLATLELSEGRKDQALARAQSLRKRHPQSADAALLEGDIQLALRNAPAAAKAFAEAYALTPSGAAAIRVYQARSITRANDATASLENWLQRKPDDVTARLVYAQGLLERGRHEQAIAQYEQALKAGPPGVMALNNLAWLYQQVKDPRAQATARKAFDLAPDNAAVADTYGWILVETGRAAEALPILERAANAPGAGPEVRLHHAAALARAGRADESRGALRQLLSEPQFPLAREARELLAGLDRKP
jgi:putative PEP-CTERM system TPR-repeat lipoprotein